jgi:hypothetical protein
LHSDRRSLPQALVACHRSDEVNPPIAGVEREDATGALAIREIEVFGMGAKRIGPVAAAGDSDLLARADEDYLVVEIPDLRDGSTAADELLVDACTRSRDVPSAPVVVGHG